MSIITWQKAFKKGNIDAHPTLLPRLNRPDPNIVFVYMSALQEFVSLDSQKLSEAQISELNQSLKELIDLWKTGESDTIATLLYKILVYNRLLNLGKHIAFIAPVKKDYQLIVEQSILLRLVEKRHHDEWTLDENLKANNFEEVRKIMSRVVTYFQTVDLHTVGMDCRDRTLKYVMNKELKESLGEESADEEDMKESKDTFYTFQYPLDEIHIEWLKDLADRTQFGISSIWNRGRRGNGPDRR